MAVIYYEAVPVAHLGAQGEVTLVYDPSWLARAGAFPVSLTMPLSGEPFGSSRVVPWLANLLPEAHLTELGLQLKVSPQDVVGMLMRLGRDTAGAFSFGEARRSGNNFRIVPDGAALERIIEELPERPFLVGEHGVSMSLAGVQDKLPVYMANGEKIAIPIDGTPSTHILKPDIRRLAGSVQNEAFCMTLARLCGLAVADVTTGRVGKRSYLLVTRYDRVSDQLGIVRRVHQEDFCQLLGLLPSAKYERSGLGAARGANLTAMFRALANLVSPAERLALLDGVIFNVLIGNSDSHAKNYSVVVGAGGTARLAPLYDLMCAAVYRNVDQALPQSIGSRTNANELHGEDWRTLATSVDMSAASTMARVREMSEAIEAHLTTAAATVEAMPAGPHDVIAKSIRAIQKRCRRIMRQL
ncbi:MAG: HipA protein [Rhizobium sp.]|nr:HipA protein [Rhizobium sp.]